MPWKGGAVCLVETETAPWVKVPARVGERADAFPPDKASTEEALASAKDADVDKEKAWAWVKAKAADVECTDADRARIIATY